MLERPASQSLRQGMQPRTCSSNSSSRLLRERSTEVAEASTAWPSNGSGAERRATIADPRSGPRPLNASARATGYVCRPRMPPAQRTDRRAGGCDSDHDRVAALRSQVNSNWRKRANQRWLLENEKPCPTPRRARMPKLEQRQGCASRGAIDHRHLPGDHNGSGVERRATIGDPRSGPRAPNASARTTG